MKRINGLICVYITVLISQVVYCDTTINYTVNSFIAWGNQTVNLVTGGFVNELLTLENSAHAKIPVKIILVKSNIARIIE
jgi:hypothetical protein